MRKLTRSIAISVPIGLQLLGASGVQAVPKTQWSASFKAAIACAGKVSTTADTRACWITQIDQANKNLNQEYEAFLNAVSSEDGETPLSSAKRKRATLVTAQADWVKYHLSHCNLYLSVLNGTMWHPVSDQCILEKIEARTHELADMRRAYSP